jgi:hypothetical protein
MMDGATQNDGPANVMELTYTQESGREGSLILNRLFCEGWETLEPLHYCRDCRHYHTRLYLPGSLTPFHL